MQYAYQSSCPSIQYAAFFLIDTEDEFYPQEIEKLHTDVTHHGLTLIVFADWYSTAENVNFFDDNTRGWWVPVTGGANVPALNDLLEPFGIAFGSTIVYGSVPYPHHTFAFQSGTHLAKMPRGSHVGAHPMYRRDRESGGVHRASGRRQEHVILGLTRAGEGAVVAYGDSNCVDLSHIKHEGHCNDFVVKLLEYGWKGEIAQTLQALLKPDAVLEEWSYEGAVLPERKNGVGFEHVSMVLSTPL